MPLLCRASLIRLSSHNGTVGMQDRRCQTLDFRLESIDYPTSVRPSLYYGTDGANTPLFITIDHGPSTIDHGLLTIDY